MDWTFSIYSDGTEDFVSKRNPKLFDTVNISIRMRADAPVKAVLLKKMCNGAEQYLRMEKDREDGELVYYRAKVKINEPVVRYQFVITTKDTIYFYNQAGITTFVPDEKSDFVLLAGYRQPSWIDGAVFYQIFPERFCNGNRSIDVRNGEFSFGDAKSVRMDDFNSDPLPIDKSHAMDFFGGDLFGIKEKIPYLKELGVTAVYLNPIFTAYSTHKYDCIDYFHVDPHFGGDEALAELSKALHKNKMRLILDISVNHTGLRHNWVEEKNEFYFKKEDGSLLGWAGFAGLPTLDYRNEELRDLIYRGENSVLRKWLKPPYNIDGWRFDVADVFARNDDVQLSGEVWREICDAIREENPEAVIIGEHWGDCSEYLQGDLWNTPMNYFGFGRIIRNFVGLPDLFLGRVEELKGLANNLSADDVVKRTDIHYRYLPQVIADCQMNLFDSHDIARIHNYDFIDFARWKIAVLSQLLWTGIPCIYYGDELAIAGYTENDAGFRFPMPWDRKEEGRDAHYDLYKKVIALRREKAAFAKGGRKVLLTDGKVLAIARFLGGEKYIGILSMESSEKEIEIPIWAIGAKDMVSDTDEFGEELACRKNDNGNLVIKVAPYGSYIFKVN